MISRRAFLESPLVWTAGRLVARAEEAADDRFTPIDLAPYATEGVSPAEVKERGWFAARAQLVARRR